MLDGSGASLLGRLRQSALALQMQLLLVGLPVGHHRLLAVLAWAGQGIHLLLLPAAWLDLLLRHQEEHQRTALAPPALQLPQAAQLQATGPAAALARAAAAVARCLGLLRHALSTRASGVRKLQRWSPACEPWQQITPVYLQMDLFTTLASPLIRIHGRTIRRRRLQHWQRQRTRLLQRAGASAPLRRRRASVPAVQWDSGLPV